MLDLLKSADLDINFHLSEKADFKDDNIQHLHNHKDILKKISLLSLDLNERDLELALCCPFLPANFKIRPFSDIGQKLSPQPVSDTHNQRSKNQQLQTDVKQIANNQPANPLQDLITQAQKKADEANDLQQLLSFIHDFQTSLSCQKFAVQTLAYQDLANIEYLWIGDAVSVDDDRAGSIYSDISGAMITNFMRTISIGRYDKLPMGQIGFLNMSFWPLASESTYSYKHDAYSVCLPFVKKLIEFINPKTILLSGEAPAYHLLNLDNCHANRANMFSLDINSTHFPCYPILSRDYILKSDVAKKYFWFDLLSIIYNNNEKISV